MLYSIGKDSAVMLHLAHEGLLSGQAALPADACRHDLEIPRHDRASATRPRKKLGLDLIVHINPDGIEKGINPFDHGSALHTQIMKTEA